MNAKGWEQRAFLNELAPAKTMNTLTEQRDGMATLISNSICEGCPRILSLIDRLSEGQTVSIAEAEILALLHSVTVYGLWTTWKRKEPIAEFLDIYGPKLIRKMRETFGARCADYFKAIYIDRETEFMHEFPTIVQGEPRETYVVGKWIRRIQGTYDAELEAKGIHAGTSIVHVGTLFVLISGRLLADNDLYRKFACLFGA